MFELQPRYHDDLAAAAPLLAGNLAEVAARCAAAAERALRTGGGAGAGAGGSSSSGPGAHLTELRGT